MIKNLKLLLLVSLSLAACSSNDGDLTPAPVPVVSGSANFAKYVALGDSFAAGYSDGALFKKGQEGSYANILSQQFALTGGGTFSTPFMTDNIGGFSMGGSQLSAFPTRLVFNLATSSPVNVTGVTATVFGSPATGAPFNNFGVPGAKSFHLVTPGYGALNPYFGRFAKTTTSTVLGDAVDASVKAHTFFSLWIGGNDVLTYATSGGIGVNRTGNTNLSQYGSNDITDPIVFAGAYTTLVNGLTANGAKGVVANIPYITGLPYFTTVPTSPFSPTALGGSAGIAQINGLYSLLRAALGVDADRIKLLTATAASPALIKDKSIADKSASMIPTLTAVFQSQGDPNAAMNAAVFASIFGQARQAGPGDYILLPTRGVLGTAPAGAPASINKFGVTFPLQDEHVLTVDESAQVRVATDAYNVSIKSIADSKGLAFIDVKVLLTSLSTTGIVSNGFTLTSSYAVGGMFSLDGVHPSPRGYALIANYFSDAINTKFGSTLPKVNVGQYGVLFPATL
jgi:hypothetical protein